MRKLLTPEVMTWLVALAAAAYAYYGLVERTVPTFGQRNAGGEDDESSRLAVIGPAARWYGLGFAAVIPLAFANYVLGMLALGALLVAAWVQAK